MTPPPVTPRKRARRRFSDRDNIPRNGPNTPPRKFWREAMQDFMDAIPTLWHDINHPPLDDPQLQIPNPDNILEGYRNIVMVLSSVLAAADNTCQVIANQYNLSYESVRLHKPPAPTPAPLPFHTPQGDPEPGHSPLIVEEEPELVLEPEPEPEPIPEPIPEHTHEFEPEPEPESRPQLTPPPQSYAAAASLHAPRRQRQALLRHQPSTPRTKPTSVMSLSPVCIVVQLKRDPAPPTQDLPAREIFRQLTESSSKVPNAPTPLGAQWNRKNNLIISFPAGTTRTAIKLLYPTIRSLMCPDNKPNIRFDVPWSKVHLAGILARDCPDLPITSEEELCYEYL